MLQKRQWKNFRVVGGNGGFTIIEVLIALVILSIGLLAVGILQNRALQYSHAALLRSRAVQSVEDILDKIRANKFNINNYVIDLDLPDPAGVPYDTKAAIDSQLTAYSGIVRLDLAEWKWTLSRSLPGGRGSIAVAEDSTDGFLVATITVQWVESINNEGGVPPVQMTVPVKVILASDPNLL